MPKPTASVKKALANPKPAPETVEFEGTEYKLITEGQATILFPNTNEVFYNPVQQFNRDMSIAAIRTWSEIYFEEQQARADKKAALREARQAKSADSAKEAPKETEKQPMGDGPTPFVAPSDFTVLEALSATGLRSIRYAKEIPNVRYIIANDLEADAVRSITRNVKYNGLAPPAADVVVDAAKTDPPTTTTSDGLVRPHQDDAIALMYRSRGAAQQFHVVDLDPYGSAAPFIDAAVQSVADRGGLLCVTCTDLGVLAGTNYPEVCFAKYGGTPVRNGWCHEMALRLLINSIQTSAARYGRYVVPVMSCSIDFYIRIFVRVYSGRAQVKNFVTQAGMVYSCPGCYTFHTDPFGRATTRGQSVKYNASCGPSVGPECEFCGQKQHLAGPAWLGPLHDQDFVKRMYKLVDGAKGSFGTRTRMLGMIQLVSEELEVPGFYTIANLSGAVHCNSPSLVSICSALLHAGYRVSGSHAQPASIKTDAPPHAVWDVMRCWVKKNPVKLENFGEASPAARILGVEPKLEANFTKHPDASPTSRRDNFVRYQENPEKHWGPMARAKKSGAVHDQP
ncbi:RNA methyltransferase tRNA(m5U54)methyltransferase [Tieghemiomyces parasiticus]|uniref:tRNA (guanine(26)-N(2))-dimethyltransferase n=1 Tax=Tieghemiomyces parasiticus TaxID=78921 RepID=A0A9W8AHQ8_9FUNG|nr:RNA methyltransferase tRNA(m5U54)methyltransferase [Tieghemiomyces parasiticus]